jgi:polyhydroxybutyrate depolymerase
LGNNHWNVGWGSSTVNDVAFTAALIDSISLEYNINSDRIYSTGMSNGGFFSYLLACQLSDRIAAIASVTGTMNVNAFASCDPGHPMPVMEIHGTADGTVPYEGNLLFASTETVLDYWVNVNECDAMPAITAIPDITMTDGCTAEHQLYVNGNNGSTVEHYKIIDGGHTWPGAFVGGAGTNQDIDASKEIWRFFSQYDINGLLNTTATNPITFNEQLNIHPNPTTGSIRIRNNLIQPISYVLISAQGLLLDSGEFNTDQSQIDLSSYPSGMYFLKTPDQVHRIIRI